MKFDRKTLIISAVVFIGLGIFTWYLLDRSHKNSPSYTVEYVDRDTGETVSVQPNKTSEKDGAPSDVTVLGLPAIARMGSVSLTESQLPLLKQDLVNKAIPTLGTHDNIVKIVNVNYDSKRDVVTGDFMYKNGKNPLRLEISVSSVYEFKYSLLQGTSVRYGSGTVTSSNTLDGKDQAPE